MQSVVISPRFEDRSGPETFAGPFELKLVWLTNSSLLVKQHW